MELWIQLREGLTGHSKLSIHPAGTQCLLSMSHGREPLFSRRWLSLLSPLFLPSSLSLSLSPFLLPSLFFFLSYLDRTLTFSLVGEQRSGDKYTNQPLLTLRSVTAIPLEHSNFRTVYDRTFELKSASPLIKMEKLRRYLQEQGIPIDLVTKV